MLCGIELGFDCRRHPLGDLVLHREDVGKLAIVALRPDVVSDPSLDELCCDTDPIAGFADAAFENIVNAELTADLLHIDGAALVGKAAVARDDEEPPDFR